MPLLYDIKLPADTVGYDEYLAAFKSEVNRTRPLYGKYIENNGISEEVADMLLRDNLFIIANQAIMYRGRNREEKLVFFTDSIFDIFNEKNAKVMIFPYHIGSLCLNFPEYTAKAPKGIVKDIMMAASAKNNGPTYSREDFYNPAYYDRIFGETSATVNLKGIKTGEIVVFENDNTFNISGPNPIEWLNKKYAGRPVYLDVSATWCGPCLGSLTASEGIREYFKDSKMAFAVIWLRSDIATWSQLAPKFHNVTHIFVPDDDMANHLMGALKVGGFPTCLFMDGNGSITKENVPGFHSPELQNFLTSKLK